MEEQAVPHPLTNGDFRRLLSGTVIVNAGSLVQAVGASWLMVSISDSAMMVALVQAAVTAPIMCLSLVGGTLADNFDRRTIMIRAQMTMMAFSVLLAVLAYRGLITPWILLALTFLVGCGKAFHQPAWQSSLSVIVTREQLPTAVATNSMSFNMMRSIGPALGGFLVAAFGVASTFFVNAVSYLFMLRALFAWHPVEPVSPLPHEPILRGIGAAFRYLSMSPKMQTTLLRSFFFAGGGVSVLALVPVIAVERLGGGAISFSLLLGCFGVGAFAGGGLNARIRRKLTLDQIALAASLGMGGAIALLAVGTSAALCGLAILIAGAFWVTGLSLLNVAIQLSTPRWILGRAIALYQTASFGGMAAGSWLWGGLAESRSTAFSLGCAASLLLLSALVTRSVRLPQVDSQGLQSIRSGQGDDGVPDPGDRVSPVIIMLEYRIDEADTDAFLAIMAERRRTRIRDGARHWTLLRSVDANTDWRESFTLPNWTEYSRFRQRRTLDDKACHESLLALHRAETPPRMTRLFERHPGRAHPTVNDGMNL